MKSILFFYFLFLYLIKSVLSKDYNFTKSGTFIGINQYFAVFDSSAFHIGDIIYFKITAIFNDENLNFIYLDSLDNLQSILNNNLVNFGELESYHDTNIGDNNNKQIRYYKLEKKEKDLNNLEGKYLILIFDVDGKIEIVNTDKDEGKTSKIFSIIFSIVGVLVIGAIIFYCFFRKKLKKCFEKGPNDKKDSNSMNQLVSNNQTQNNNPINQINNQQKNKNNQNIQNIKNSGNINNINNTNNTNNNNTNDNNTNNNEDTKNSNNNNDNQFSLVNENIKSNKEENNKPSLPDNSRNQVHNLINQESTENINNDNNNSK